MPPTPDAIGVNCATPEWSPRVLYANHSHDARSWRSQHCPKSTRDPRDDWLFRRLYTGQFRWWSMPRINFTKRMPNRITCRRINDSQFQFDHNPESPLNPNSNSEIEVTLRPSHDDNRQSTWWRRRRRSNEFSKGGDNHLSTIKSYQQLKAHLEAIYRDTHRVDREVYLVDQDSAEAAYRERNHEVDRRVTKADFQRWLPNQDELTSQCQFPMTTSCKIYSIELAEALHRAQTALARLNLVSIAILEKLTC